MGGWRSIDSARYSRSSGSRRRLGAAASCCAELARKNPCEVYADEPLRVVVYRMADKGFTRMPVIDRTSGKFLGLISLDDLLKARSAAS